MLKNYLKTAWRNLIKNKTSSIINIGGLAVGMAVAMLIGLWVYDEVTFDQSNQNYKSIAQVTRYFTDPHTHDVTNVDNMHYPTAALLKKNYTQYFKHVVMAWWVNDYSISSGEKKMSRQGEFIEPEGLEMLAPKMIEGNYSSLNDMHAIVISRSLAKALFGNADPIGKSLEIDNRIDVMVTGVYENIPANNSYSDVGVRKVIGASVFDIWNLLSKEFIGLVIISLLIASPIAYLFMNKWVQKYTYHTNISLLIFLGAGVGALLITIATISFQAIKAAIANPIRSLRTE